MSKLSETLGDIFCVNPEEPPPTPAALAPPALSLPTPQRSSAKLLVGMLSGNWRRVDLDLHGRFTKLCPRAPLLQFSAPDGPAYSQDPDGCFEKLVDMACAMRAASVTHIMVACTTVHLRRDEFMLRVPGIHMFDAVAGVKSVLVENKYARIGLMATTITAESGLYESADFELLRPCEEDQEAVSQIIVRNKPVIRARPCAALVAIMRRLVDRGAEVILLGAADLSSLVAPNVAIELGVPLLDALDVLVAMAGKAVSGGCPPRPCNPQ